MKILKFASVLLIAALACGCASGPRHTAVVVDEAIFVGLSGIQTSADVACADVNPDPAVLDCRGPLSTAKRQTLARHLVPALTAGRDLNRVIGAWRPGTPVPAQLSSIVSELKGMIANLADDIPGLGTLRAQVGATTSRVMDLLITLLAFKGV